MFCEHIEQQLEAGVIERAQSDDVSPIGLVFETGGTLQVCVDYRRFNPVTIPDIIPLLLMNDHINSFGEVQVFLALDALWGYRQVPIEDEVI